MSDISVQEIARSAQMAVPEPAAGRLAQDRAVAAQSLHRRGDLPGRGGRRVRKRAGDPSGPREMVLRRRDGIWLHLPGRVSGAGLDLGAKTPPMAAGCAALSATSFRCRRSSTSLAMSTLFLTFFGNETSILRLFRLIRILSLAKLGRYSSAIRAMAEAVKSRRYELLMSLAIAGMLLLTSSTLLYIVEGDAQPATFGSIPRAMWWSIATLDHGRLWRRHPGDGDRQGAGRPDRDHRHRPHRHADRHPRRRLQRRHPAAAGGEEAQGAGWAGLNSFSVCAAPHLPAGILSP